MIQEQVMIAEVARFEGSSDADGSGGTIRLTTSNGGIQLEIILKVVKLVVCLMVTIGTTEYNGVKTLAITIGSNGYVGMGIANTNNQRIDFS